MPSKKSKPIVILDVANLKSVKSFSADFPNVSKHLVSGKIKTASGGEKFNKEMEHAASFIPLFIELAKANLVVKVPNCKADEESKRFQQLISTSIKRKVSECDDPHIFSLLKLTNSKTVVSFDKRIAECKKCLRKSSIKNSEFANARLVKCDKNYLKLFNASKI